MTGSAQVLLLLDDGSVKAVYIGFELGDLVLQIEQDTVVERLKLAIDRFQDAIGL